MDRSAIQKVVVVNGNTQILEVLGNLFDEGSYDMVFVETDNHAYSEIRKVQPNLVIFCANISELNGFQLLTMLKLDSETRNIPVLTYTTESEDQDFETAIADIAAEDESNATRKPLRMN